MSCKVCGRELVIIDYPYPIEYHVEDTKWGIWPDHETGDPGWIVAKTGAKPASMCKKVEPKGNKRQQ